MKVRSVILVVLLCGGRVHGDASGEMARAARADAYRRICARLLSGQVQQGESVGEVLVGEAGAEVRLRRLVLKHCAFAGFRIDERERGWGRGRVTATVRVEDLLEAEDGPPGRLVHEALEGLRQRVFVEVGIVEATADGEGRGECVAAGWEHVTSRGVAAAARAAREDLAEALVEGALLRLEGTETVDRGRLRRRLMEAAQICQPRFEECQVCVITGSIDGGKALEIVEQIAGGGRAEVGRDAGLPLPYGRGSVGETGSASGGSVGGGEREANGKRLEAVGYGMAPVGLTRRAYVGPAGMDAPRWAFTRLVAQGRGALPAGGESDEEARLAAEVAARADAVIQLAREVDGLSLPYPPGVTVRQFIMAHGSDDDVWAAYVESAVESGGRWEEEVCVVTMELDLAELWGLIGPRQD